MKRTSGFTLIELLVVILVIGILAGILIPVAVSVKTKGQISQTVGFIKALETAMEAYKSDCGVYPEHHDPANTTTQPTFLYYLLETGRGAPYTDRAKLKLSKTTLPTWKDTDVQDSWGNAFRYYRAPILGATAGGSAPFQFKSVQTTALLSAELAAFSGNKQSFNLWSPGPDGENNSGTQGGVASYGDDVVNWK